MAPSAPRPALLLPLALLAACLALASGQIPVELNKIFQHHHVDYPRAPFNDTAAYCQATMRKQGLYGTPVNTFIHLPNPSINSICTRGRPLPDGLRGSYRFVTVTVCRWNPQSHFYGGTYYSRRITIGCWNRLPVYYKE